MTEITPEELVDSLFKIDLTYCDDIGEGSDKFGIGFLAGTEIEDFNEDLQNIDAHVIGSVEIVDKSGGDGKISIIKDGLQDTEVLFDGELARKAVEFLYEEYVDCQVYPFNAQEEDVTIDENLI